MTAGTSLVVQWLRIHLPMQGTWVWSLVWEDPTCRRATKPVRHNYRARVMQLLKPACLEPMLRNKRSHHNEKPAHCSEELPLLAATRESPCTATKTQCRQEEKKKLQSQAPPSRNKVLLYLHRWGYKWKGSSPHLSLCSWRYWGSERLSGMAAITQLVGGSITTKIQDC